MQSYRHDLTILLLLWLWCWLLLPQKLALALLWSAVPPSPNPRSKLNEPLLHQLNQLLLQQQQQQQQQQKNEPKKKDDDDDDEFGVRVEEGRLWFEADVFRRGTAILRDDVPRLPARSLRIVAAEASLLSQQPGNHCLDDEEMIAARLFDGSNSKELFSEALQCWERVGNHLGNNVTFAITCQQWSCFQLSSSSSQRTKKLSMTKLANLVGNQLSCLGWKRLYRKQQQQPTLKFHLLLCHEDCAILELVALVPPTGTPAALSQELPRPGFKRAESFALVQSAAEAGAMSSLAKSQHHGYDNDTDGRTEIWLDPMCGKGTFLVEAAAVHIVENGQDDDDNGSPTTTIKSTHRLFYGVDGSTEQLARAHENVQAAGIQSWVSLQKGDARNLGMFADNSVDVILTCPPFGRQFAKGSRQNDDDDDNSFYLDLMQEWSRVLDKTSPTSRMAILIDVPNVKAMRQAVDRTRHCHVSFVRRPFRLGRIRATIMMIRVQTQTTTASSSIKERGDTVANGDGDDLFDWEMDPRLHEEKLLRGSRAAWAALRSMVFTSRLTPYSSSINHQDT